MVCSLFRFRRTSRLGIQQQRAGTYSCITHLFGIRPMPNNNERRLTFSIEIVVFYVGTDTRVLT